MVIAIAHKSSTTLAQLKAQQTTPTASATMARMTAVAGLVRLIECCVTLCVAVDIVTA